ncbi:MAG: FecR domain-containing protein [Tannerellaceae bacterium]|jgi:ferric-dicitrate binding protein FerR (iron transport regulator)|nr:FecR domain-containing protein [Tannerellaceae bacterium]
MKNYIRKILHIFSSTSQPKETVDEVHHWLIDDSEHAEEKMSALRQIWNETENTLNLQDWVSYEAVSRKINLEGNKDTKKHFLPSGWRSVAAAIIFILSISGTYFLAKNTGQTTGDQQLAEYFSSVGDKDSLLLPDGSRVMTNSTTLLVYPKEFNSKERIVYLIGEANFSVQKDTTRPFIVKTKYLNVTALGTQFNVKAYSDDPIVYTVLIEGSIRVESKEGQQSRILSPGEQLAYNKTKRDVQLTNVDLEEATAWQRGEIVFKSVEVGNILRMLERKYEITFQYKKGTFNSDKYNFRFKEDAPLTEIMDIIQTISGSFNYTIKDDICYLSKR